MYFCLKPTTLNHYNTYETRIGFFHQHRHFCYSDYIARIGKRLFARSVESAIDLPDR